MSPATSPTCARCGEPITAGARFCMKCGADVSGEQGSVATAMIPAADDRDEQEHVLALLRKATIGEYEIQRELGRGGMATVYLAHDIALDRKVAIKVMSPALALMGAGMSERFKREARTAANLSHPHIIPIYTVKSSGKTLFFVMKFIPGRSLESIISELGPMPISMVRGILQQVGSALGYAHRNGVVHRDVKPANIMIDEEGWAVVTDFGIAKVAENRGLTMTGIAVGTPSYMSPEQCAAKEITGKSDQYSLGVVAYEMLTGRQPFEGDSAMAIMFAHFHEQPKPLTEVRSDCPAALAGGVMRMLDKTPEQRWPSLEDALSAMGAVPLTHEDPVRQQLVTLVRSKSNRQILESITPAPTSPIPPPKTKEMAPEAATTPIPATRVTAVTITPAASTLQPGETVQLTASPRGPGGTGVQGQAEWVSSDVAIVSVTATGLATALTPGKATVSATYEGIRGVAEITVTRVAVATVAVEPAGSRLTEGETVQLRAKVQDGKGAALIDRTVVWKVTPAEVARVSPAGLVTADRPGNAEVTAECEGVAGRARLEVQPPPVASLSLTPATRSIAVGDTAAFAPTLTDARGRSLAERPLTWSSSSTAVAAVSPRGIVTGMGPGTAEITVRCEGKEARASVTVTPVPVGSVTVKQPDPLIAGARLQLQAVVKDARGAALTGRTVKWTSSSPGVLTVSASGECAAVAPGSAKITAECEGKSWTITVVVQPVPIASIAVEGMPGPLRPGASATLSAVVRDAGGKPITGREVTWVSSAPAVAEVSAKGVVTARGPGKATISAMVGDRKAEASLTVVAPAVTEARTEVLPQPAPPAAAPAAAPAAPPAARPMVKTPVTERVPEMAPARTPEVAPPAGGKGKLIGAGAFFAVLAVVAFVLFRLGGTDVPPPPPGPVPGVVASLTLSGETTPVPVGRTHQLSAVLTDAAGAELGSRPVVWSSSDPSVAEVSPLGAVTGKRPGSVTIMATSEGQSDSFGLIVEEAGEDLPPAVASITLSGGGRTVDVGATVQLSTTLKDENGASLAGRTVVWSSKSAEVVSVNSSGLVTALAGGTAEIEASSEGKSATTLITVNQPAPSPGPPDPQPPAAAPVATIVLGPANPGVTVGQSLALSAELLDARRNPLSGRPVEWKSSDVRVATVSADGMVTGVARGTATITATAEGRSATTRVTVAEATVAVAAVTLTPAARSIKVGETTTWTGTARDARGRELDDRTVSWSSSAPQVATVRNGAITGVAAGTAEIRAEVEGKNASASIMVVAAAAPPLPGPAPVASALLPRRGMAAGGELSCGIATGGAVCWGAGYEGVTAIDGTAGITAITTGRGHGCGLLPGGRAVCWGDNRAGQLGDGGAAGASAAVAVAGGLSFTSLSAGAVHTCGIAGTRIWCWGKGRDGQLGDGSGNDRKKPVQVRSGESFTAVAAGGNHTCAITAAGKAWCWGDGFAGQLGFGGQDRQTEPVDVSGDLKFTGISAGAKHSCGLTAAGKAYCWGANEGGQLGDGSKSDRVKPQAVEGGLSFSAISAGATHTCGLSGSDIYCWGENQSGQLGDGTRTNRTRPVPVSGGLGFTSVSAGESYTCGLTRGSEAVCWGENDKGQLGDGTTESRPQPDKVRASR